MIGVHRPVTVFVCLENTNEPVCKCIRYFVKVHPIA